MMRRFCTLILSLVVLFVTSCGDEYTPPTYPDVILPMVLIEGATESDTGIFSAENGGGTAQTFNLSVDAAESIFPDCTLLDSTLSLSDSSNFSINYTDGSSTFTISTNAENQSSDTLSATVTAVMDAQYGGGVSLLTLTQLPADIPYFTLQPQDVTFGANLSVGATASTSFIIDPANATDITKSSFTVTESEYFYTSIQEVSGSEYGYILTFTATMAAVNALSSSALENGLEISCVVTMTYDGTERELSDTFTVYMPS